MPPHSNNDVAADRVVEEFRAALGEDILKSVYLCGSRARGDSVHGSDLDVVVIVDGLKDESVRQKVAQTRQRLGRLLPVHVDAFVLDRSMLSLGIRPDMKESTLCFGQPLLESTRVLEGVDLEYYYAKSAVLKICKVRGFQGASLPHPLTYPDPTGEFFGYDRYGRMDKAGAWQPGMEIFLNMIAAVATYRLFTLGGAPTRSKLEAIQRYEALEQDPWRAWVKSTYSLCRGREVAELRADPASRAALTEVCRSALAYETQFIELYRTRRANGIAPQHPSARWMRDFADRCLAP